MKNQNEVIVIDEVKLMSGTGRNAQYSAIGNDSNDHSSEISKVILRRAAEAWNGKTIIYRNTILNKWMRTSSIDKIQLLAPTKSKSKKVITVPTPEVPAQ
jgi:hypothetical protein